MTTSDPVRPAPANPRSPAGSAEQGPAIRLARTGIGPFELAFFVVAAAGPLLVVAGFAPLAFLIGGGGAPRAPLGAGPGVLLFSRGVPPVSLRIPNPRAVYSHIRRRPRPPAGGGGAG